MRRGAIARRVGGSARARRSAAQRRHRRRRRPAQARPGREPAGHRTPHLPVRRDLRGLLPGHPPAPRRTDHRRPGEPGRPAYRPGGNTALGSHDQPGLFGVTGAGRRRIVWHYRASDERRTYDISYRVIDGAVAYDDVIDVGWTVWGNQWHFDLPQLTAQLRNPALDPATPLPRLGPPARGRGETTRRPGIATLRASDVPDQVRRDAGHRPAPARPERQPGPAPGRRRDCRGSSPRRRPRRHFNSSWNDAKRFIAHHAVLLCARSRRARAACLGLLTCSLASARRRPQVPARAPRRRQPGARLRARARGRRQHQHRACDADRPDRPRLLRRRAGDDGRREARPGAAEAATNRPERQARRPTRRDVSASSTS